jgi:hypothetical protein
MISDLFRRLLNEDTMLVLSCLLLWCAADVRQSLNSDGPELSDLFLHRSFRFGNVRLGILKMRLRAHSLNPLATLITHPGLLRHVISNVRRSYVWFGLRINAGVRGMTNA